MLTQCRTNVRGDPWHRQPRFRSKRDRAHMDWLDAPRPSNTFSFSEDASFLTEKRRFVSPPSLFCVQVGFTENVA